jgi:hypothetical protein
MVVCRDLVRGSLVCEAVAAERPSPTWYALAAGRLEARGGGVGSRVRDRATALSQRADHGREGVRRPAVCPRSHALVQSDALAMGRPLRHARPA